MLMPCLLLSSALLGRPGLDRPPPGKTLDVPYRLSAAKHIIVRVKLNGRGPYHFVIDTGAPTVYVTTALCHKLGIQIDDRSWCTLDRLELEGGIVAQKVRGRGEDPYQIEALNTLRLDGVELHGIIGYTLLAHYRIQLDVTRDTMRWTELSWQPEIPERVGSSGGLSGLEGIIKQLTANRPRPTAPQLVPRGFFGIELGDGTTVTAVTPDGPAAKAGIQVADRITHFRDIEVRTAAELLHLAARIPEGTPVKLSIERAGQLRIATVTTGASL